MIADRRFPGRLCLPSLDCGRTNQFPDDNPDELADQKMSA
jgi:hypothetical protein